MATETAKRKQTLSVLDQMRTEGMPRAAKYQNKWSGEELPEGEDEPQANFDADKGRRVEQSQVNTMPEGPVKDVYNAIQGATGGVQPGATGMSKLGAENPGMTPYSPEEYERRSSFSPTNGPIKTGVEALDQPLAKSKRSGPRGGTEKKKVESE